VVTSLTSEIRTSFDYYESQSASSVAKIFLSGGGSRMIGLKDMLANFLGIEVEYWDPLKQIILSSDIDPQKIKALFSQFAVAVGLALRS
jgi:type IV pilus assembly protein PilM